MQSDMHYYGTYALARAAGLKRKIAQVVASAAEYVDDATESDGVSVEDGRHILPEETAHKMIDYKNADPDDQRRVWLPFHFLPAGEGTSIDEKLVCRKNSAVAKAMVARNLATAAQVDYGLHLLGITAHVYADTFAHYGFIGANSPMNGVKDDTLDTETDSPEIKEYILNKAKDMLANILSSAISDAFPLGHGAVATFPDRPYLRWQYRNSHTDELVVRDNRVDYLEGSKSLYDMFQSYLELVPSARDQKSVQPWTKIRANVKRIIALEADKQGRANAWKKAMREPGAIIQNSERIPDYLGDQWTKSIEEWHFHPIRTPPVGQLLKSNVHLYYRAAREHRNYIITDLLPSRGILAA